MARKKPVSEWSPAYRNRVLRSLEKNPWATASEATGRKRKNPPPDASSLEFAKYQAKKLRDNLELKRDLGMVNANRANAGISRFNAMLEDIKTMYTKFPPGTRKYYDFQREISKNYKWLKDKELLPADRPEGFIPYH